MNLKRIAIAMLVAVTAGLMAIPFSPAVVSGNAAQALPCGLSGTFIQTGDFFFQGPAGKSGPFNAPEVNVAAITGAASGEIVLVFKNVGGTEHEILSALFLTTTETIIKSFDAKCNEISKVESIGSLREVEVQPEMTAEVTLALDEALVRSLEDDPNLALTFEIVCHVDHGTADDHYKKGMRGFITLKP